MDETRYLPYLKVLADKQRLRILSLLLDQERTLKDISWQLELSELETSLVLNGLEECGLVTASRDAPGHYALRLDDVHAILRQAAERTKGQATDENSSEFEQQVIRHFFTADGALKEIPASRNRQLVVLRHLLNEFAVGEFYSERQVNEIFKRFHPDCATLRRQMIDFQFMARANNQYWRLETSD